MKNYKKNYYTPSELSLLSGCSRQLLVYYDNEGIFKPAFINEHGYRYYHLWQWGLLEIIISLRKMEVPLNEIKEYVNHPSPENLTQIYKNRLAECQAQIDKLQHQKQQLERCIQPLEAIPSIETDKIELIEMPKIVYHRCQKVQYEEYPKQRINTVASVLLSTVEEETTNDYLLSYSFEPEEFFQDKLTGYYVFLKEISPVSNAPKQTYLHLFSRFDHNLMPQALKHQICSYLKEHKLHLQGKVIISPINSHLFSTTPDQRINEIFIPVE